MKTSNEFKLKVGGLLALLLITTSCGQGFQPSSELKSVGSASCVSCEDGGLVTDPWEKVDVESIMPTNEIFGVSKIVEIDKVNSLILVNIPLPPVIGGIFGGSIPGYPIPQLPGATLGIVQNGLNYAIQLSVPLRYVVKGVAFTETGLPNGDSLPGIPDGELPQLGLKVSKKGKDVFLYLGKGAIAVFVPFDFKYSEYLPPFTFPLKNKSSETIGYLATVEKVGDYDPGVFFSIVLPDRIQRILDNIIP